MRSAETIGAQNLLPRAVLLNRSWPRGPGKILSATLLQIDLVWIRVSIRTSIGAGCPFIRRHTSRM